jgi:hypothetical protein
MQRRRVSALISFHEPIMGLICSEEAQYQQVGSIA